MARRENRRTGMTRSGRVQVWAGLLLLTGGIAYPIAWAAERFMGQSYAAAFIATVLILALALAGALAYSQRKDVRSSKPRTRIEALTLADAASMARAVLSDSSKFEHLRRRADTFPFAKNLAPHVLEFFSDSESLKAVHGDAVLVRAQIGTSSLNPRYIRIGRDIESVEINVLPGQETIYEIDAFDPSKPFDQHRSIYHWVLTLDETLYG